MDPLHIFIRGERLLDTDDVSRIEGLNAADPYSGSVSCQYGRIDLAHLFEGVVILGRYIAGVKIIILSDDFNDFPDDSVVMAVPFDLNIQKQLFLSASGEFYDLVQRGDLRSGEILTEEGSVVQIPERKKAFPLRLAKWRRADCRRSRSADVFYYLNNPINSSKNGPFGPFYLIPCFPIISYV